MNSNSKVCLEGDVIRFIWEIEKYNFYTSDRGDVLKSSDFILLDQGPLHLEFYPSGDAFGEDDKPYVYLSGNEKLSNVYNIDCSIKSSHMYSFDLISGKAPRWNFKKVYSSSSKRIDKDNSLNKKEMLVITCKFELNQDMKEGKYDNEDKNNIEVLSNDIEIMCFNSQMSDFTLIYNESKLHLHKAILYARSPRLAQDLNIENCSETNIEENFFNCKVTLETLKSFLFYVYSGKIPTLSAEKIQGIYYLSHRFEIDSLKKKLYCNSVASICRTRFNNKKYSKSFTWDINDFDNFLAGHDSLDLSFSSSIIPNSELHLVAKMELKHNIYSLKINIHRIYLEPKKPIYVSCNLNLLNFTGESKILFAGGHLFKHDTRWEFPNFFNVRKSDVTDATYTEVFIYSLTNGINLCEKTRKTFQISFSLIFSSNEVDTDIISIDSVVTSQTILAQSNDTMILSMDLEKLYNIFRNKTADIFLKTGTFKFPAHKVILSARSLVFRDMFENKILKKETETVDISDIDADTLKFMLIYIYSGKLDNSLPFDSALSLYKAANIYDIVSLKNRCTVILKITMNEENVCDLLVAADMYSDVNLKIYVKEYICERSDIILSLPKWAKFTNDRSDLASEVSQMLIYILSHKKPGV